MEKVLGIVSGKGGVGKTSTAINLGLVLNNHGRRVVVVDGDLLKPNIGSALGIALDEIKEHTIHHAIKHKQPLDELVYVHTSGLKFIPGNATESTVTQFEKGLLTDMKSSELILLDTPPGFGEEARAILKICDAVLVVVTPDTSAVQDGMKTIRLAEKLGVKVLGVVVNRFKQGELSPVDIQHLVGKPILGVINEEKGFAEALAAKHPLVYLHPESKATDGFKELAARLLGEKYVKNLDKKQAPYKRMLKKLGLM